MFDRQATGAIGLVSSFIIACTGCGPNTADCRVLKVCLTDEGGTGQGAGSGEGGGGGDGGRFIPPSCGDGEVQADQGEECDDGNTEDGDACEADCTLPRCGNAIVDSGEVCLPSQAISAVVGGGITRFGAYIGATDCDSDGDIDVLLMAGDSGNGPMNIVALRNAGDGTFLPPVVSATPFRVGRGAALARLDGDGSMDVALAGAVDANSEPEVRWFSGAGACNFGAGSSVPQSTGTVAIVSGNLDGDGQDDLLFLTVSGSPPNSTYAFRTFRSLPGTTSNPTPMAGNMDIVLGNVGSSEVDDFVSVAPNGDVEVRYGLGGGSLGPPQSFATQTSNGFYGVLELADVDGNGALDVLMINVVESWLQTLLSDGAGVFIASATVSTEGSTSVKGIEPVQVTSGDLDNDGVPDVVTANSGGLLSQKIFPSTVSLFRGSTDGMLAILDQPGDQIPSPSAIEVLGDIYFPYGVEVVDLNGDGASDIVVVGANGTNIAVATLVATP